MDERTVKDLTEAWEEMAKSIGSLADAFKELDNALPKRKVLVKNEPVEPKKYGLYLQQKKRRKKK